MKFNNYKLFVIFSLLVFCTGIILPQDINYKRNQDVIYGRKDGMALTMDVFNPEKANGIGVILLISGGWTSSHEKINKDWLANIETLLNYGLTVFAVVHSSQPKYKIPDMQKDISRAVRYIRYNSREWNIDPRRLGISGASSGGNLALLTAMAAVPADTSSKDPVDSVSPAVGAVACFYPPTDFLFYKAAGIDILNNEGFKKYIPAFINDIEDTTGFTAIAEAASPVKYLSAMMVPTLIIAGTNDRTVPFQQTQIFIEKLKQFNIPCKLEVREGKGHGWDNINKDYNYIAEWFVKYLPGENTTSGFNTN